jgi:ElaB/YqjD/DUF883 family membrane-anchored ribosome-binding protein
MSEKITEELFDLLKSKIASANDKMEEIQKSVEENRKVAENSINEAWDVFSKRYQCDCGNCPVLTDEEVETFKEAFFGGAIAFLINLKAAMENPEKGSITSKLDKITEEIDEYSSKRVLSFMVDLSSKGPSAIRENKEKILNAARKFSKDLPADLTLEDKMEIVKDILSGEDRVKFINLDDELFPTIGNA